MDRGVARDPARRCRALRKFRCAGCCGLLPGWTDRPRACLSRRCGGGPVAARGAGTCRAVSVWHSALAGHRGWRSPARGLLDAVRDRPRPDGGEHARTRDRSLGFASPDRRAGRARTRVRRAGPRRVRVARRHHQRRLRAGVAAPRRRDRRRRTRARLSHMDAGRRVRRPGPGARPPDVGRVRLEGHPPAGPRRDGGHARSARGAGRAAPATRRALHRVSGALVGGAALGASWRRHGDPRRLLDHRLEHSAKRGTVRAGIDHRQPPRHAALHRDLGDHIADPRCSDRRAHGRNTRAGGYRGGSARARRRAGGTAQGRHARCRRGAAEPRLRAGNRGGRPAAGTPRRERHALRRRANRHGRRRLE
jgi:hypothetical protein